MELLANVLSQTIRQGDFSTAQSYNYDSLNRLTTVLEQSSAVSQPSCVSDNSTPCQQFGYDRWGNRWVSASAHVPATVFEPTGSSNFTETNRLNLNGSTFDNAGNLKTIGGYSWAYDAEGRLVSSEFTANGITSSQSFVYDGEGRRVKKGATVYVYDALGQLAAEYNGVSNGSEVQYLTADHLGSTRLVVDGTTGLAVRRMDYLPFGMSLTAGYGSRQTTHGFETSEDTASLAQRFTGKERDAETGLDYFGARYFSGAQGRFTSADPVSLGKPPDALILMPQRWNAYAYALNNPLANIDRDGRFTEPVHKWITTQTAKSSGYSRSAIAILNDRNKHVDRWTNILGNREHGMLDTYNSVKQGYAATAKVITDRLESAVTAAVKGDYASALDSLGQGTHTVQDLQAHGMMYLEEHPTSEVSIDNDSQKVQDAQIGTADFLGAFDAAVIRAVGDEKGQKILDEVKNYKPKKAEKEKENERKNEL